MTTDTTPQGDTTLTISDEDAAMLAHHATFVQGGYSTPEIERERVEKSISQGRWTAEALALAMETMREEVREEMRKRVAAVAAPAVDASLVKVTDPEPAPATAPAATPGQVIEVDVSSVANAIDQAIALRARIKALQTDLEGHETQIKDVMGEATVGVIGGEPVVKWPIRNRTNLVKAKVKEKMSPEDFAECETTTIYRPLEFTKK